MKKIVMISFGIFAGGLLLNGCALTLHGTQRMMSISSVPPGAKVSIDGFPVTQTPGIASFGAKPSHVIVVEKEGCESQSRPIPTGIYTGALVEEILLPPGLVGIVIDFATGAIWSPKVAHMDFSLVCGDKSKG